jgi:hypothetical protein
MPAFRFFYYIFIIFNMHDQRLLAIHLTHWLAFAPGRAAIPAPASDAAIAVLVLAG